jgi:hypothetical protein
MTLANRSDLLDACMADSNLKKLQGMGKPTPLCREVF